MKLNYFNFKQYGKSILMTNDFGKYMFVSKEDFRKILALDGDGTKYISFRKCI